MDPTVGVYTCPTHGCPSYGADRHVAESDRGHALADLTCHCGAQLVRVGTLSKVVANVVVDAPEHG